MHDKELINHPEGGRYKEIYRSTTQVTQGRKKRSALTHIYFSLNKDEVSMFHKVNSDEVWNLYQGQGITLYVWDNTNKTMDCIELSSQTREYCFVVKAGLWQAAMPIKEKVLAGCSVAPGFEFQDFELIDPSGSMAKSILKQFPQLKKLVNP
ncbi:MAG: cupin domain-containing protein [Pseudomonadota bacterium]